MVKQPFFSFKGLAHHPIETTITPPPKKKQHGPYKTMVLKKNRHLLLQVDLESSNCFQTTGTHLTVGFWAPINSCFLVPLIGGRWYIITHLAVYTTSILPIGWLYIPTTLGEPGNSIDPKDPNVHFISGKKPIRFIILSATWFLLSGMYCQLGDYILDTTLKNPFLELQTTTC